MADASITCPKCGNQNLTSAPDCSNCGISFEIYKQEKARARRPEEKTAGHTAGHTDNLANCPNCSHPTDLSSKDCLKCGIVFSKYFDIRERDLENEPEKLKRLLSQKEAHERAMATRHKREAAEAVVREKKLQVENAKAEALKKQRIEQERQEEAKQQQAEKEKQAALKQQQEAFEQKLASWQQQAEKEKQEALRKQSETQEKAEIAHKQQVEQEKLTALEKQQAAYVQRQAALKRQAEKDKQEALDKLKEKFETTEDEIRRQADLKLKEALDSQRADCENNRQIKEVQNLMSGLPPRANVQERLKNYEGQTIGVNHEDPSLVDPAVMIQVGEDHFSILPPGTLRLHSYPFTAIASVVEEITGIPVGNANKKKTVYLVIKVHHG